MEDKVMAASFNSMVLERVDVVDRRIMESSEYENRQTILAEFEALCERIGCQDMYRRVTSSMNECEYLLASNCYLQGFKDNQQVYRAAII